MRSVLRSILGIALAGALPMSVLQAEEAAKTLPTLLIKGEVVSFDSSDPAAPLLKVKDRYGFETPIFLGSETKVTQGEAAADQASLTPGSAVEVEYNFDVNTAKRHAVSVKIGQAAASAEATPAPAVPAAEPAAEPVAAPAAEPAPEAPAEVPQPAEGEAVPVQ